jgi:hypothetical protein
LVHTTVAVVVGASITLGEWDSKNKENRSQQSEKYIALHSSSMIAEVFVPVEYPDCLEWTKSKIDQDLKNQLK